MKNLIRDHWPIPAVIAMFACAIVPAIIFGSKQNAIVKRQKIQSAELELIAVRNGLGEFYVSTNTATIEFRLKEKL